MCDACVVEAVKERMLSRRRFFRASGVATAAAGAATMLPRPAPAATGGDVVDLTHEFTPEFPTFGGNAGIAYDKRFDFASDGYNLFYLTIDEHAGTHVDAPLHFSADGASVAEIAPQNLVCPLCVVDIRAKAAADWLY